MSRIPLEDRGAVVFLHKDGLTTAEICRKTGFDRRFVTRWISRYNDSGSLDDAASAGRKRKLSKSVERTVEKKMRGKRRRSSRVIARELKNTEGCRCELRDSAENNAPSRLARHSDSVKPRDCLKPTSVVDCGSLRPTPRRTGAT